MYHVPPNAGERFYLRLLLTDVPGAMSFEHLRTVNGVEHDAFQAACAAKGLLHGDQEWNLCLRDACVGQNTAQLRKLFAILLLFCQPQHPETLWQRYRDELSRDKWFQRQQSGGSVEDAYNDALLIMDGKLNESNKTLQDFPSMPLPVQPQDVPRVNPLLQGELNYDRDVLADNFIADMSVLNMEQAEAVRVILQAVEEDQGGVFFIDGPGGAGKTFVYRVLLESVRATGSIALAVASSRIAALRLTEGITLHN